MMITEASFGRCNKIVTNLFSFVHSLKTEFFIFLKYSQHKRWVYFFYIHLFPFLRNIMTTKKDKSVSSLVFF